ncbi:MAG: recombinase family protein [Herbinix sp.]|jgi:DNA invertase Pin-like site-specific DNA recombinase|nr:recombinase family protein [Herbinix sp.]
MKYVGYHRTSTTEQHLDRGINEIRKYCSDNGISLHKDKVYTDQQTGKDFNRPSYQLLKQEVLESDDILIITEVDRLGRNRADTLKELQYFKDNKIRVLILELPTSFMDVSRLDNVMAKMVLEGVNNMLIDIFTILAEGEMHKREKRQREGIQAMKDKGEWHLYGRPAVMNFDKFSREYERTLRGEIKPFNLMRELKMAKGTYYRYKKRYESEQINGDKIIDFL